MFTHDDDLLKASQVLKRLEQDDICITSKQAFSQSVSRGVMPYLTKEGKKGKYFNYDAVVYAITSGSMFGYEGDVLYNAKDDIAATKDEIEDIEARLNGSEPTLTDANILKTIYAGKREKLKYQQEQELLIEKSIVEDKAFNVSRSIRDKILTIPERLSNELATIDNPHVIKELLFKEFGILLDGFSEASFT